MTFETKFRSFVGRVKQKEFSRNELIIIADELLREYNEERKVVIHGWKGKSSFSFEEVGDKIIVTKFQRPEKDAEPKEIKTEISIHALRRLHSFIFLHAQKGFRLMRSRDLAELYYGSVWKDIFNDRARHNKFTIMLNVLEQKGFIEYRGGRVYFK